MKCEHLSPSRSNKYESCPLRYHANYELGVRDSETTRKNIGLLAHKCFELYYNPANFRVSAEDCFMRASELQKCPDMEGFMSAKEMFLTVAKMGGDRAKMNIIGSEIGLDFFTEAGTRLRGFIDRLEIVDAETIRIVDYKTGMWVPPMEEIVSSHQSKMYPLWVYVDPRFKKFSRVIMKYIYPRMGVEKEFEVPREGMVDYVEYLEHLHNHIVQDTRHEPTLNGFCYNCGYRDRCSEYTTIIKALMSGESISPPSEDIPYSNPEETLTTFVKLKDIISCLDKEKDIFASWSLNKLKYSDVSGVTVGDNKFTLVRKKIPKCDVQTMKNLLYKYSAVDRALEKLSVGDLEKIFEGNKPALDELAANSQTSLGAPYILTKKIGKEKNGQA